MEERKRKDVYKENWTKLPEEDNYTSILGGNRENACRYIERYIERQKVEISIVEDLESEAVKCRNLGEKEKERYLAEVRLMLKGKWARRS